MNIDIIVVTYNSQEWIKGLIKSISNLNYNLKEISLIFVDNNSKDSTLKSIKKECQTIKSKIKSLKVIKNEKNEGFGIANNIGAKHSQSEYLFFLNVDTELEKDSLKEVKLEIEKDNKNFASWELRQFPYEHPKLYNPVTLETSWSSGACVIVKKDTFEKINGFDKNIFMYAEDVDLSWRIRATGKRIKYVPKAIVNHFCYKKAQEIKPNQYYNSIINNLYLRFKFGNILDIISGLSFFAYILTHPRPLKGSGKELIGRIIKNIPKFTIASFYKTRHPVRFNKKRVCKFVKMDYEISREGAFIKYSKLDKEPLVSIITRTCGRPAVLYDTLESLNNQTYKNFEIIIVEDGKNSSQQMIEENFSNLRIKYHATNKKVGRCEVGNIGLKNAKGDFFNFLDDDDVLFGDHIETLVKTLQENPNKDAVFSYAFETPIQILSKNPYRYKEVYHNIIHKQEFNKLKLIQHNYFPIQTIMFKKELFKKYGGFDKTLEYLEDWDLWIRFALDSDFLLVKKVTSSYRVPYCNKINKKRQEELDIYYNRVKNKHLDKKLTFTAKELLQEIEAEKNNIIENILREKSRKYKLKKTLIYRFLRYIYFKIKR